MSSELAAVLVVVVLAVIVLGAWFGGKQNEKVDAAQFLEEEKKRIRELNRQFPGMGAKKDDPIFGKWLE